MCSEGPIDTDQSDVCAFSSRNTCGININVSPSLSSAARPLNRLTDTAYIAIEHYEQLLLDDIPQARSFGLVMEKCVGWCVFQQHYLVLRFAHLCIIGDMRRKATRELVVAPAVDDGLARANHDPSHSRGEEVE